MTAESFVHDLVVDKQVAHMVVGDDFRFGCDRQGDFSYLIQQGAQLGFSIEQSATHRVEGSRISSSRIRHLLKSQDFDGAQRLLGRPYALCGRVIYGQQLGRKIGFPTANIALSIVPALLIHCSLRKILLVVAQTAGLLRVSQAVSQGLALGK
jgi:riboflavin kinase/FMN adenylyltransferase